MAESARRIVLQGAVQGCGMRPALARLAARRGWSGCVKNTNYGVELIVQGQLPDEAALRTEIITAFPEGALLESLTIHDFDSAIATGFHLESSTDTDPLIAPIPRDRAICAACLREIHDPTDRRYHDPFATCTQCGPRYSLLWSMPFDRERTAMNEFPPCAQCVRDYHDPLNRRFHAQTISCPQCGPKLWLSDGRCRWGQSDALWKMAADALQAGKILAVRGIGGYQLLADATSSAAVHRLRDRKQRSAKPFAVLCRHRHEAQRLAELSAAEIHQLATAENPIVLVRQRQPSPLCRDINPGLVDIGLMLPTSGLHDLLLTAVQRPLICTSGNLDGEPLAYEIEDAERQLSNIADLWLHHDREIVRPIDDSVVRVIAGSAVTLRAGRGIAPLPIDLGQPASDQRRTLACGGQQKSALAWATGSRAMLGPHLGDLETLAAQDRWRQQTDSISSLLQFGDEQIETTLAGDHHPEYFTSEWAQNQKKSLIAIWHHHAHVLAGMAEHHWLDREVLGVAWDGTGFGPDGTIWGGEFLKAASTGFERLACFRPFFLPGGEAAITDLRRTAVAILSQVDVGDDVDLAGELAMTTRELGQMRRLLHPSQSPFTTSCGRLFDAAAYIILQQPQSAFEGHAAMCLEAACDLSAPDAYEFVVGAHVPHDIDWRPVYWAMLCDRRRGLPRGNMAMKFHRGLARVIVEMSQRYPTLPVVLHGGVFQNRVLTELVAEAWTADGSSLGLPGRIPPNDGGLAVGQLAGAIWHSRQENSHVSGCPRPSCGVDRP